MAVTVPGFREWTERAVALAEECCGGRLVAFLEGGYSLRHLPAANLAILEALAGLPPSIEGDPVGCDVPEGLREVERAAVEARRVGRLVIHDAHGWWIAEAGAPAPLPALAGDVDADVVVVGGGYTGMWTAWEIAEREPNARVVVLEADALRDGAERAQRRLPLLAVAVPPAAARASTARRAARELCEASVGVGRRRSARGARPRRSTRGTARRRTSSSPARPRQDGASAGAVDGDERRGR